MSKSSEHNDEEMTMKHAMTVLLICVFFASSVAWADCVYNGQRYATGSKVGGRTCQANGSWR
jgi:hypothetical protein